MTCTADARVLDVHLRAPDGDEVGVPVVLLSEPELSRFQSGSSSYRRLRSAPASGHVIGSVESA